MNVLLISLDTTCASHLGCYGHQFDTSPNIDRLASQSVLFERCYATDVPTPPSYTAMLSGRFGVHNGIFGFQPADSYQRGAPMLQEVLAKAGYRTCALSNLFYVCPWLLPGWCDIMPPGLRFQKGTAPGVTDEALAWLKRRDDQPFFLFAHYWEPHQPYTKAPEKHRKLFPTKQYEAAAPSMRLIEQNPVMAGFYRRYHEIGEGDGSMSPAEVMARYDSQIHFVDEHVGRLLEGLHEMGHDKDTLLILTSDHGEAFGEYGTFDHMTCYENIAHVPLLMRLPGTLPAGTRVSGLVTGADIMPTALDAAGMEVPAGVDATSLIPVMTAGAATPYPCVVTDCNALVTQRMIVEGHWGLVHTINRTAMTHLKTWELFDLDGDCEKDLSAEQPDRVQAMKQKLEEWLEEQLRGEPDPLVCAGRDGGWAVGHGHVVWSVLEHLEEAVKDPNLWPTFRRHHGGAVSMAATMKAVLGRGT